MECIYFFWNGLKELLKILDNKVHFNNTQTDGLYRRQTWRRPSVQASDKGELTL